ncbi:ABC transporter ATP-binding protein [Lusitaniella coriacea LEGE 07157]|uniref:Spermidine/putrescine import ATP-binding protein PotA n=1 Tax=Lusitaniella coriacea LEGE 07157 TaxID=945747 RepID=A0A8J7DYF5_9CYAN|nr:ABC transporter ATP-binding protein [Lusitaniella coriacea]MBE9117552.1 ABC transporter ATP-binding protein [Lusitaniella coriacea LEGE 07157]
MHAVELKNISKRFSGKNKRDFLAVDRIDLPIAQGEFFSLLGPSGCGKTTLLRMIAGFELPTSGEIFIHGEPMRDRPPFHRPVNTVFQNYALFPHLTVADNVAFGLQMEQVPKQEIRSRVGEALAMVKLNGMENRRPRQLSGGQQQRVALARALVKKPQVLLFDEPLAALDLKLRKEMQIELKHMQQQLGITFIFVTHDQGEALTMSDRIAVLNAGKVLQVGTPTDIYEEPRSRFVADFIGETNFLSGQVQQHQDGITSVLVDNTLLLNVARDRELPIGTQVTLIIRPEKAMLYPLDAVKDHCIRGTVEEIVYLGTDTRFVVRLTPQSTIVVRRQNLTRSDLAVAAGKNVQVRLSPGSLRILEEDKAM